jgi:hypothetical protein
MGGGMKQFYIGYPHLIPELKNILGVVAGWGT